MRLRTFQSVTTMVLGLLLWTLAPTRVDAHWADQAVAQLKVAENQVDMLLTFPTRLAVWADDDRDGRLSPAEVEKNLEALVRYFSTRVRLSDRGTSGNLTIDAGETQLPASLNVSTSHSTLRLAYHWPERVAALTVRYDLFLPGVATASCLATIAINGRVQNFVFTPEHREAAIDLSGSNVRAAGGFVLLGIRHILTGYDHVLFLLSLLMLGGGFRALVKIVTAFTIAHSLTLSLAALNIVALPSRWVESAIAASIVYVAAENFWRRGAVRNRWLVTFGFGLMHGLGFASILQELDLPRAGVALSLLGFNTGVEIGQLGIVILASLGLRLLRAWPREAFFRLWVSAGAGAAGLVWFVQRAFLGS